MTVAAFKTANNGFPKRTFANFNSEEENEGSGDDQKQARNGGYDRQSRTISNSRDSRNDRGEREERFS